MSADREVVLLALDMNPILWTEPAGENDITIKEFLDQIFAFLSQMILTDVFQVAPIIAYNQNGARFLFPDPDKARDVISGRLQATNVGEIQAYCETVIENLQGVLAEDVTSSRDSSGVRLDVALSLALCHLNQYPADVKKRIIVLAKSPDATAYFESTMNALFAAHRIGVVIDSLMIKLDSHLFLNQAALLTGGFSMAVKKRQKCLIQYLLSIPPLPVRDLIVMEKVQALESRTPAVNEPHRMIAMGLMCPVCLSVFEDTNASKFRCSVCKARMLRR